MLFYGASSISTIWYEANWSATLSMGLNFISFLLINRAIFPKIDLKKMNFPFMISFVLMMIINGYLIYELIIMIKNMTHSSLHYILMVLSTMTLFIAAFFALLYNHKYSSKGTLVFSIFIVLIVFAEVFRAIGYYNFAYGDVAVYIARILLIIASALVVHYSMLPKKEDEALNRRLF